jgi:pyruvate/oxaloacetate carboxyltransferase
MTHIQDMTRDDLLASTLHNLATAQQAHTERLKAVEAKLDKIYKVLDTAVERFGAVTQSPMLAQLFSSMTQPPKKQ